MPVECLLISFGQFSILTLALASGALCVVTSLRAHRERRSMAGAQESLGRTVAALSGALAEMQKEASETELRKAAPLSGLNLTKRAQALRMHRRGESVSTIAAALQSPRNEIELLLKVDAYLSSQNVPQAS